MDNILQWFEDWYTTQCNGEWEHEYGVKIYTLDNPGWSIQIDLKYTILEHIEIEYHLIDKTENDWYSFSIKDGIYNAAGDPKKLLFLLTKFREITEGINLKK